MSFKMAPCPDLMSDTGIHELELWKGGPELPAELETYVDCNGTRCYRPKGEGERMRQLNWASDVAKRQRTLELNRREVIALRLDEIDPDWPDKFISTDQAARFYWAELAEYEGLDQPPKRTLGVINHSPYQPPEVLEGGRDESEDDL